MEDSDLDAVRLSILVHLYQFMRDNGIEDMTETDDEYVLRQLAKAGLFSISDVVEAIRSFKGFDSAKIEKLIES
jgi:hypothetical protein